jgi:hypothetical protein
MTAGDWAFILIVLITLLCAMVCALAWKLAYADGHEAGRQYERNRQNTRRIRENRTRGLPATSLVGRPPWDGAITVRREVRTQHMMMLPAPVTQPIAHPHAPAPRALLTDTGSFAVSTERFIADMRADEEAYRRQMRQEIGA